MGFAVCLLGSFCLNQPGKQETKQLQSLLIGKLPFSGLNQPPGSFPWNSDDQPTQHVILLTWALTFGLWF